jgi:polynucleotide 5'-hydroxyl-kinase GRC3/NOL9
MASEGACGEWREAIGRIVEAGGLVVVMGAPDTGKTTFCRCLALASIAADRATAIVDADVGQSEIGPPACVSLAMPTRPFDRLSAIEPCATAFVGSISPRYAALEHLAAVCRVVGEARSRGAELTICDTTGYVRGLTAMRLKRAKMQALRPDHLVRLVRDPQAQTSRAGEAVPGVGRLPMVHSLPVPGEVVAKPLALRTRMREARFVRAFEGASAREWALEEVETEGTWLGAGKPLTRPALDQLSRRLRAEALYGEVGGGHLGLICRTGPSREAALVAARELYGALDVSLTVPTSLNGLLVGLHDGRGDFVGLGRVSGLDYAARVLRVTTPSHSYTITRSVHFGLVCLSAAGQTLAVLRPGDV